MHDPVGLAVSRWQYLFFAIAAAILVFSHTPVGAALSMDSLSYLSTARNILDGHGIAYSTYALVGPEYQPTTLWPPLYPTMLAGVVGLAGILGISDVASVAFFNFLAMLVSLILILRIAALSGWTWAVFAVGVAFTISPSLQLVHMYAWSEALYIPLSLAAYLGLIRYLGRDDQRSKASLYWMVALLAIATYTRYVGIAYFGAAAMALLVFDRGSFSDRIRIVVLASLAYLASIAPMLIRNLLVSDAISGGDRGTIDTNLVNDLGLLFWYLYLEFVNLPNLAGGVVLLCCAASAAWILNRGKNSGNEDTSALNIRLVVPFLFIASYFALLLVSRMTQVTDLDSRMLSVAVPFVLLGLHAVYELLATKVRRATAAIPFVLLIGAFVINAANTHSSILAGWREQGEPGMILGLSYPSMTGPRLDTLRGIGAHFGPGAGDLVLTDIRRTVIASYLFPDADVRVVPDDANEENIETVAAVLHRKGLAIIGEPDWGQALTSRFEDRADFYRIESADGRLEYIVITLPVRTQ